MGIGHRTIHGFIVVVWGMILFCIPGCTRSTHSSNPPDQSFESLNPIKARGAPLWIPILPDAQVSLSHSDWIQVEPFNRVDSIVIHFGIKIKSSSKQGIADQYQMIVFDIKESRKINPNFWRRLEIAQAQRLAQQVYGYWVAKEQQGMSRGYAKAWVKLGNVWLMLAGDRWVVESLVQHYIERYKLMLRFLEDAGKFDKNFQKNVRFLVEYSEFRVGKPQP